MAINAGEATVDQLYSKGYIRELSDLYKLTPDLLITLDKWKEKSVSNFLESLSKSREVPFERVLFALGIRHIGETTAKNIAMKFGDIWSISRATMEELLEIDEVGEKLADSLVSYFSNPLHIRIIQELEEYGLQMKIDEGKKTVMSDILKGMTIVISGNFSIPREEMKALIEANGGKPGSSISGNTTYMVAGDKCGPAKLEKATKLGVAIIDEAQFFEMINK